MSETILVAGGAGFLGSHLCTRLHAQGHYVICVDNLSTGRYENIAALHERNRFEVLNRDIRSPLPRVRLDRIFNLACPASPPAYQSDPIGTVETCVLGSLNLLRLAERSHASILTTSTSEVYGEPAVSPQPETYRGSVNPVGPRACYDEGKRVAETLCYEFRCRGVDTKIARLFNTYGPGMQVDDGRVVTNLISQALTGRPLTIYGDGTQTRSFCYVDDLIDGLIRLAWSPESGPVNLGNPDETTMLRLAELVAETTGTSTGIQLLPLPVDDPTHRCPDITLARTVLGWTPRTSLRVGLRQTAAAFADAYQAA